MTLFTRPFNILVKTILLHRTVIGAELHIECSEETCYNMSLIGTTQTHIRVLDSHQPTPLINHEISNNPWATVKPEDVVTKESETESSIRNGSKNVMENAQLDINNTCPDQPQPVSSLNHSKIKRRHQSRRRLSGKDLDGNVCSDSSSNSSTNKLLDSSSDSNSELGSNPDADKYKSLIKQAKELKHYDILTCDDKDIVPEITKEEDEEEAMNYIKQLSDNKIRESSKYDLTFVRFANSLHDSLVALQIDYPYSFILGLIELNEEIREGGKIEESFKNFEKRHNKEIQQLISTNNDNNIGHVGQKIIKRYRIECFCPLIIRFNKTISWTTYLMDSFKSRHSNTVHKILHDKLYNLLEQNIFMNVYNNFELLEYQETNTVFNFAFMEIVKALEQKTVDSELIKKKGQDLYECVKIAEIKDNYEISKKKESDLSEENKLDHEKDGQIISKNGKPIKSYKFMNYMTNIIDSFNFQCGRPNPGQDINTDGSDTTIAKGENTKLQNEDDKSLV